MAIPGLGAAIAAIAQALASWGAATGEIAENQGLKIPMREEAILAKAKYKAEKLKWKTDVKVFEARQIRQWSNDFEINNEYFSLIQEGRVRNKIENLVRSNKVIYKIEIRIRERYYACIRYIDNDDCETWTELPGVRVKP